MIISWTTPRLRAISTIIAATELANSEPREPIGLDLLFRDDATLKGLLTDLTDLAYEATLRQNIQEVLLLREAAFAIQVIHSLDCVPAPDNAPPCVGKRARKLYNGLGSWLTMMTVRPL